MENKRFEFTEEQQEYIQEHYVKRYDYEVVKKELDVYKSVEKQVVNVNRLETICGRRFTPAQGKAIEEWAKTFERSFKAELVRVFEQRYKEDLSMSVDNFIIAIAFVLHFGEKTRFGQRRIKDVLMDIEETVDLFRKKEYTPKDYLRMLREDGIILWKGERDGT